MDYKKAKENLKKLQKIMEDDELQREKEERNFERNLRRIRRGEVYWDQDKEELIEVEETNLAKIMESIIEDDYEEFFK